jgi:hypothetical protein
MHPFVAPGGEVDFNKYSIVIAFGDSTMGQLAQRNLIWPEGNIGAPLSDYGHGSLLARSNERESFLHPSLLKLQIKSKILVLSMGTTLLLSWVVVLGIF